MSEPKDTDFEALARALYERCKVADEPPIDIEAESALWVAQWRAARIKSVEEGGCPKRVMDAVLGDLTDTPAMLAVREDDEKAHPARILIGGVGSGKSTAAGWVLVQHGGDRPGWLSATELERRGRYDRPFNDWLFDRSALVIDDLGVEPLDGKGYFSAMLDEIVDAFYGSGRRCVVTTNLVPDRLVERYGARVWSRWRQVAAISKCGDVDLRRKK